MRMFTLKTWHWQRIHQRPRARKLGHRNANFSSYLMWSSPKNQSSIQSTDKKSGPQSDLETAKQHENKARNRLEIHSETDRDSTRPKLIIVSTPLIAQWATHDPLSWKTSTRPKRFRYPTKSPLSRRLPTRRGGTTSDSLWAKHHNPRTKSSTRHKYRTWTSTLDLIWKV